MYWAAKSLQRAAEELELDGESVQSDHLLFEGKLLAVPVLLTLATEIGLKALQCQEKKGAPPRSHDLLALFDGLGEAARARLEATWPEIPNPLPGFPPIRPAIRETLSFHRHAFQRWRYMYEYIHKGPQTFQTGEIKGVLAAIVGVYEKLVDDAS